MGNLKDNWPTYLIFGGLIAGNVFYVLPLVLANLATFVVGVSLLALGTTLATLIGLIN